MTVRASAGATFDVRRRFFVDRVAFDRGGDARLDVTKEARGIGGAATSCQRSFGVDDEALNEMHEPPARGLQRRETAARTTGDKVQHLHQRECGASWNETSGFLHFRFC